MDSRSEEGPRMEDGWKASVSLRISHLWGSIYLGWSLLQRERSTSLQEENFLRSLDWAHVADIGIYGLLSASSQQAETGFSVTRLPLEVNLWLIFWEISRCPWLREIFFPFGFLSIMSMPKRNFWKIFQLKNCRKAWNGAFLVSSGPLVIFVDLLFLHNPRIESSLLVQRFFPKSLEFHGPDSPNLSGYL